MNCDLNPSPGNPRQATWNQRHRSNNSNDLNPSQFLIDHISFLKKGSVIDLACGRGRNAIYLAEKGFLVTGVDFSDVALKHLAKVSQERNLGISGIEIDLENSKDLKFPARYDNVIITNYKSNKRLLDQIPDLLNHHGIFLYTTFNHLHKVNLGFNEKFCLREGELLDMSWDLTLLKYESYREREAHLDGYIFQKNYNKTFSFDRP